MKECVKCLLSITVLNLSKEMENMGGYLTLLFNGVSHNKNVTY